MARNVGKFLLGAAVAGAVIAGGIAYFNKCKHADDAWEDDFEDFEDEFEDDLEDELDSDEADAPVTREYVTIPKDAKEDGAISKDEEAIIE